MSRPRTVGLNALFLDPGVSGGSETYLRGLVPALAESFPGVRFELATTRRGAAALRDEDWADVVTLLRLPCDDDERVRRTLVEQASLPRLAGERGWDVLHSMSNRGPRWVGAASVVTVHDMIFFHHRTMGALSTYGMRWAVRAAVAGADALISVSGTAAEDISRTLRIPRDRIVAIPHGPGLGPERPLDVDLVRERHGLTGHPVVLCVAAKRPHKNQRLLVEALGRLQDDVRLVLVGHDEGYGRELEATAAALGVADRVLFLERVPAAELEALWASAGCAAFPTRAEGFGLPVVEAMRREVPVACSDIPVLREVAGDAARFFDPADPAAAAAAITACLDDPGAGARGRERADTFTWERTAAETFAVYERALDGR